MGGPQKRATIFLTHRGIVSRSPVRLYDDASNVVVAGEVLGPGDGPTGLLGGVVARIAVKELRGERVARKIHIQTNCKTSASAIDVSIMDKSNRQDSQKKPLGKEDGPQNKETT